MPHEEIKHNEATKKLFLKLENYLPDFELNFDDKKNLVKEVRELIDSAADLTAKDKDGNTPLHYEARKQHTMLDDADTKIFDLLLDSGADINARNSNGWTPFQTLFLHASVELPVSPTNIEPRVAKCRKAIESGRVQDVAKQVGDVMTAIVFAPGVPGNEANFTVDITKAVISECVSENDRELITKHIGGILRDAAGAQGKNIFKEPLQALADMYQWIKHSFGIETERDRAKKTLADTMKATHPSLADAIAKTAYTPPQPALKDKKSKSETPSR